MHNCFSIKWVLITSIVFLSFNACSEETIVYSEIENPNYTINTLTLPLDKNKVFQINPTLGGNGKFFFGDVKGSENLFSLFSLTLFSGSLPPTALFDLLADSIQVDSALVYMQTGDSLNSTSNLSLYSILATEDSIFSEDSTSYYSLDNYIDLIIASEDCIHHKPDPEPYLKAIEYFNANKENVFIFEDSYSGYCSAKRTHVKNICLIENSNSCSEIHKVSEFKYNDINSSSEIKFKNLK